MKVIPILEARQLNSNLDIMLEDANRNSILFEGIFFLLEKLLFTKWKFDIIIDIKEEVQEFLLQVDILLDSIGLMMK